MNAGRDRLPDLGPERSFTLPRAETRVLRGGVRLWTVEQHDVPVLAITWLVPAGSAADPPERPGLAALVADLLDEGSGDRRGLEFHEALARIGGQLDIDTGAVTVAISLVALARFREAAFDLAADLAFRPRLEADDVERVLHIRRSRLAQLRDVPGAVAERALLARLFGDHPYGHLAIGTDASLAALCREDVAAFHRSRYGAAGTMLVAVGDASHEALAGAAESALDRVIDAGGTAPRDTPGAAALPRPGSTARLVLIDRPGAPQSELRVGCVAAPRRTPDYHDLLVLNAVLGGQFVSRLNVTLREEKGFTYGARSYFDCRRHPGPFVVQTSVQTSATAEAVREVHREVAEIGGARPPTPSELSLAHAGLTRGYARHFETAEQVARATAQLALHDLPERYYEEFPDRVRGVGADQVTRAARRWLKADALSTVVVGDRARVADGLDALGLGPVEVWDR